MRDNTVNQISSLPLVNSANSTAETQAQSLVVNESAEILQAQQILAKGAIPPKALLEKIQVQNPIFAKEIRSKVKSKIATLINSAIKTEYELWISSENNNSRRSFDDLLSWFNPEAQNEKRIKQYQDLLNSLHDGKDPYQAFSELKELNLQIATEVIKRAQNQDSFNKTRSFNIAVLDLSEKLGANDMDGDGKKDYGENITHDRRVKSFISANSKLPVKFLSIDMSSEKNAFNKLRDEIESGTVVDAINLSLSLNLFNKDEQLITGEPAERDIADLLYPQDKSKPENDSKNVENKKARDLLIKNIKSGALNDPKSPTREEVLRAFEISPITKEILYSYRKLVKAAGEKGIPIYISASNNKEQINAYSLIEPTITVGATDARGKEVEYSSKLSPVDTFAQGTYNIYKTSNGFDYTGDGVTDVEDKDLKLSGGKSRAQFYDGKPYTQSLYLVSKRDSDGKNNYTLLVEALVKSYGSNREAERKLVNKFKGQIFIASQLIKAFKGAKSLESLCQWFERRASEGEYVVFDGIDDGGVPQFIFYRSKVNNKNEPVLFYDPANTGKPGAIGVTWATSWAVPTALIRDLNKKVKN